MSLTGTQIQKAFKIFGKLIQMGVQGPSDAVTYRTLMSAISDQIASGSSADASAIINTSTPAATQLAAVASTLDTVATQAKTLVQTYLQQVMAVDAGLTAGVAVATIGAKLITDMTTASQTVVSSGGNPNGILAYFATNFSIQLPPAPSGSATIPDNYITNVPN